MVRYSLSASLAVAMILGCAGAGTKCGEGTVEVDGACVAEDDSAGPDDSGETSGDNGGESGDETTGDSDVNPAQDPQIISFTTNVTELTVGSSIELSILATDPQGIDDLIGGTLLTTTGATYGTLAADAQEGAYTYTVEWREIQTLETIPDFDTVGELTFTVVMYDQAGHDGRDTLTIPLSCSGSQGYCGGECLNLSNDVENCGSCANDCTALADGAICDSGACWERFYTCDAIRSLTATDCDGVCGGLGGGAICPDPAFQYDDVGTVFADAACTYLMDYLWSCSTDLSDASASWYLECQCAMPL